MLNQEKYIEKCKSVWGDAYDFSKTVYTKATDKVVVTCRKHGDFEIEARQLYRGHGCYLCGKENAASKRFATKDNFIEKASNIHKGKYDYSLVNYTRSNQKVKILCPKHGVFEQKPNDHLSGRGCPKCKREKLRNINLLTIGVFLERSVVMHGDRYDYSKVEYAGNKKPVTIICPLHGEFKQTPKDHMNGSGCPVCGKESSAFSRRIKKEEFVEKAISLHGLKYDYTDTDVSGGIFSYINIRCLKHGVFRQRMGYHLNGNGCRMCAAEMTHSSGEMNMVEEIKKICHGFDKIVVGDRSVLNGNRELDVYIPEKKIAFEYDGVYWHSEACGKSKDYHIKKTEDCAEKGIKLIHIFEDEWSEKKEICLSRIKNLLGVADKRVFARNCEVKTVPSQIAYSFLKENHIQGKVASKIAYGLYYNGNLISLMTFGKLRRNLGSKSKNGSYELLRFCNKLGYSIPGAASRLFAHFVRECDPENVVSYADRRWSDGNLYEKIGFKLDHISRPNYFYAVNGKRYNRFNFRKDVLVRKYGCPENMTEYEFCRSKNWWRIYDCGCLVYKWAKSN